MSKSSLTVAATRTFLQEVRREAEEDWSLAPRLAIAVFVFPLIGGAALAIARLSSSLYRFITDEDSILEWLQFAGYAAAAGLGIALAIRLARSGDRWGALAWLAFGVGCVFVAGEEISWGQRIFGFSTPEALQDVNRQGESNIHNIRSIQDALNVALLLGGLYGFAAPWIAWRRRSSERSPGREWLFVPPLFLTSAFAVLFAYKLARFTVLRPRRFTVVRYGEWAELGFAFGLSMFAALVYARRQRER